LQIPSITLYLVVWLIEYYVEEDKGFAGVINSLPGRLYLSHGAKGHL